MRVLSQHVRDWRGLSEAEQEWMLAATGELLATRRWEAANGFDLTDEMCTVIAAQVALACLGFEEHGLDAVASLETVIVHPRAIVLHGTHGVGHGVLSDESRTLHGEAHDGRGPLLLAWTAVRRETTRRLGGRRNVVIHEIAHKLDMIDGVIDGTPPLEDEEQLARWAATSEPVMRSLRYRVDEVIDEYGATNPAEFFAVVSELFFASPVELAEQHPDLYVCYRDFYGQDTAARRLRSQP